MPADNEPLQDWGLSHANNNSWRTYYTSVKLDPPMGTAVKTFLTKLGEMRNGNPVLKRRVDHNELRIRLVSIPTLGSHDAMIVWQATNDEAVKDFLDNALANLCSTNTLAHAMGSGTHG